MLSQAGPSTVRDTQTLLGMLLRSTMGAVTTSDIVWDKRKGAYRWRTASPRASGLDQASTTAYVHNFPLASNGSLTDAPPFAV